MVVKDEPVFVGAVWVFLCFKKVGVLVAAVVCNKICNDFDVVMMAGMDEQFEVCLGSKVGVDTVKVSDVVAMIGIGFGKWANP